MNNNSLIIVGVIAIVIVSHFKPPSAEVAYIIGLAFTGLFAIARSTGSVKFRSKPEQKDKD